MKKLLLIIIVLISISVEEVKSQHKLVVTVEGVKDMEGSILISLSNTPDTFMKQGFKGQIVKVKDKKMVIHFDDIPSGIYAVSLFHDKNDNRKLDTGLWGIPKEKYGFSNNAKGKMGPPSYDACTFKIEKDTNITINLK